MADTEQAAVEQEQTEQPTEQVTAPTTPEAAEATIEQVAAAASTAPAATAPPQKYLGQFDTPEQAAMFYKGQAEAFKSVPAQAGTVQKADEWTPEKLLTYKTEQFKALAAAQVNGDAAAASAAAAQIAAADNKMMDIRLSAESRKWQGQSTMTQLVSEGQELLKPYQNDLVPGNPLNEEATRIFSRGLEAFEAENGQPMPQSQRQLLGAYSVLAAAAKTGKTTAGVEMNARQEFGKAMQGALKTAVLTGAGKAAKPADKTPDFMSMTDDEFRAYERKIGVRS